MPATISDEQNRLAHVYSSDLHYLASEFGLRRVLGDPISSYDEATRSGKDDEFAVIANISLREALRLPDEMFEAMATAHENIQRKVEAQYDDSRAPGSNARYEEQWTKAELFSDFGGTFSSLASCQGGEEVALIFAHPIAGVNRDEFTGEADLASEDEYRERTSPYVAAFGREVYPGDLEVGLVLDSVKHYLEPGVAQA